MALELRKEEEEGEVDEGTMGHHDGPLLSNW